MNKMGGESDRYDMRIFYVMIRWYTEYYSMNGGSLTNQSTHLLRGRPRCDVPRGILFDDSPIRLSREATDRD